MSCIGLNGVERAGNYLDTADKIVIVFVILLHPGHVNESGSNIFNS